MEAFAIPPFRTLCFFRRVVYSRIFSPRKRNRHLTPLNILTEALLRLPVFAPLDSRGRIASILILTHCERAPWLAETVAFVVWVKIRNQIFYNSTILIRKNPLITCTVSVLRELLDPSVKKIPRLAVALNA